MSLGQGGASGSWESDRSSWQQQASWAAADDAYLSAAHLSARFQHGQGPPVIATAIMLGPAEYVAHCESFSQYAYSLRAVSYDRAFVAALAAPRGSQRLLAVPPFTTITSAQRRRLKRLPDGGRSTMAYFMSPISGCACKDDSHGSTSRSVTSAL